jgi:hypothetical protein
MLGSEQHQLHIEIRTNDVRSGFWAEKEHAIHEYHAINSLAPTMATENGKLCGAADRVGATELKLHPTSDTNSVSITEQDSSIHLDRVDGCRAKWLQKVISIGPMEKKSPSRKITHDLMNLARGP